MDWGFCLRVSDLFASSTPLTQDYFLFLTSPHHSVSAAHPRRLISPTPECRCFLVLPTQLYLVHRQMRREALEAFCSNAHFDFYDDNLGSTLPFLRDFMPREGLSQLNRVKFMTESHCTY